MNRRTLLSLGAWPLTLGLVALLFVVAASAVACGDDDDDSDVDLAGDATESATNSRPGSETATSAATGTSTASRTGTAQATGTVANVPGLAEFKALTYDDAMTDGFTLGKPEAKVTLTMFEDFQCPFCLRFTLTQEPTLIKEYVETGKIKLVFRNLPILGQESALAAVGAECAAQQDRFWQFHKELFVAQAEAGQLTDERINVGRYNQASLQVMAGAAGMDVPLFATCITTDATLNPVRDHVRQAQDLGLRSTPSFTVGTRTITGAPQDAAGWRQLLDEAVKAAN
ncbi:MAG: thioredoxin domain-containing protein [Dehalococcoidia bacterium]|nr:thioredoxin domain-containing protein [Dehalococcoidia bacterium]